MENKIDIKEFHFIDVAFMQKADLKALTYGTNKDCDCELRNTHMYLQRIIESDMPIRKTLILMYNDLKGKYYESSCYLYNGKFIPISDILWGRIIVVFYYFYYGMPECSKIYPKMMDYIAQNFTLCFKVKKAMGLIDAYENEVKEEMEEAESAVPTEGISEFRIAEGRKTDVIKVLYYMMKLGMFTTKDGKPIKEKEFMLTIGKFFDADFKLYAQTNSKSSNMNNYLNVFDDLRHLAANKVLGE